LSGCPGLLLLDQSSSVGARSGTAQRVRADDCHDDGDHTDDDQIGTDAAMPNTAAMTATTPAVALA